MNVLSLLPQIPHWGYLLLTEEDIQTHTQRLREIFAYTLILVGLMPLIFTHLASLCNRWVTCLVPEIEYNRRYPTVRAHEQSHSLFSAMWLPLTYHVYDLPAVSILFHACSLFQGFWSFSVYVWVHSKRPNSHLHTQGACICEIS